MTDTDFPTRILVIDGAADRQDSYRRMLERDLNIRATLVPADSAEKGLTLARTFRPQCILLHSALADTGASGLLSALAAADGPGPAIVIATDRAGEAAAIAALTRGAHDYVVTDTLTAGQLFRAIGNAHEIATLRAELARAGHGEADNGLRDPLTSLAARTLFFDRFAHSLILAKRNNHDLALLMLELDGLKVLNLSKGHEFGDAAIVELARRLKQTLRKADTIARFDGSKFAVILQTGGTEAGATTAAQKILDSMQEPLMVDGIAVPLDLNIGISLFPIHGGDSDTLIHHADTAMAQAAEQGGGFVVFTFGEMLRDFHEDDGAA